MPWVIPACATWRCCCIPRSCKLDSQLNYVDVALGRLELAAVQVGEQVARVPDLVGLERLVRDAELQPDFG